MTTSTLLEPRKRQSEPRLAESNFFRSLPLPYTNIMGSSPATIPPQSKFRWLLFAIGLVFLTVTGAFAAGDEAKRILALIDYIGGDYRNAVQGGKVVSADEYTEMSEFSARSLELFSQLKSAEGDKAGIEKDLKALAQPHTTENRRGCRAAIGPADQGPLDQNL